MSTLLSDENGLRELSKQIQKQDKSLWNKIKAWFNDVIARITAAYKGVEPGSEEAKILMEQKELFEHAQKVFAEAVVKAGENYQKASEQSSNGQVNKADTNAKFQARNYDGSQQNQEKDAVRFDEKDSGGFKEYDIVSAVYTIRNEKAERFHDLVPIGTMPDIYKDKFGLTGTVYVSNSHLYANMVDKETAIKEGRYKADEHTDYHALGEQKIVNAIEQFQNPMVIMESLKDFKTPRLVTVLDEKGNDGQNLIGVMELYRDITYPGAKQSRNHILMTIYEKNDLPDYIGKTVNENRVLYIDKRVSSKTAADLRLVGSINEETLNKNIARFNRKVKDFKEENKIKYQLREYSPEEKKQHIEDAIAYFGTTYNWNEAGYLIPDGRKTNTRGITKYAKENGYDGVIFKGIYDSGGLSHYDTADVPSTIAVAFSSEQVKDVDNKAPTKDPDIRYSVRKKVASFNPKSYNGIKLSSKEYARLSHAVGTYQPQVRGYTSQILDNENGDPAFCYQVFVEKSGRLIVLDKYPATNIHEKEDYFDAYIKREEFDRSDSGRGFEQRRDDFSNFGSERRTDAGSDKIFERGNSSSTQSDDRDDVENLSDNAERKWRDFVDYFFEDGKQFYQDRLSNADKNRLEILGNKTNRLSSDLKTLEKAFGKLIKEEFEKNIAPNEGLSKRAEAINEKAAKRFMNEVGTMFQVPKETREEYLLPIINEIIDKGPAKSESEGLVDKLYNTAYDHTEDYIVDNDPDGTYKNLRNYIRRTPVFVDNGTRADVGDYNAFRKANMGSLSLTSDAKAIPLDGFYSELSGLALEFFSGSIDGAEQLYEMSSKISSRRMSL